VRLFTVLFGVLTYWLLGFLVDDISTWPGPEYQAIEDRMLDPDLVAESKSLAQQLEEVGRNIDTEQSRQAILRDSTNNAQTTMNQLLEFQRLSLQKGVTPTAEEQSALGESQQRFLANQSQYEQLTERISQLQEQRRGLEDRQRTNQQKLDDARVPILAEFKRLSERHDLTLASIKLALLTPVLVAGVVVFMKRREGMYAPLVAAFAVAIAVKAMFVMHAYFPERAFKYVLIVTFLVIVTGALVSLIRMVRFPKPEWLQKQFREAYEAFLCPICAFPIRRGPLKYLFWTRRSIKRLHIPSAGPPEPDAPYCCPACGTKLFEECGSCRQVRHSLLPTCQHCGRTDGKGGERT
jgi:hypothetical protein